MGRLGDIDVEQLGRVEEGLLGYKEVLRGVENGMCRFCLREKQCRGTRPA